MSFAEFNGFFLDAFICQP